MKVRFLAFPVILGAAFVSSSAMGADVPATNLSHQSASEVEDIGEIAEDPSTSGLQGTGFRVSSGAREEYTSNAKLSGNNSSSDGIFFPSVEAGYSKGLGHGFSFDLNTIIEAGLYADRTERSFIGYSAQASLDWRFKPSYPRFYIGLEPYRFDRFEEEGLITEALGTLAGTDWGFAFNSGYSYFFAGYTFENYISDPGIDTRFANRVVVGITHQIRPQLFAQGYYQYQYSDYQNISRVDNRHSVSVALIWQINRHLFANVSGSFIDNNSTELDASYQATTAAIGVTWQF